MTPFTGAFGGRSGRVADGVGRADERVPVLARERAESAGREYFAVAADRAELRRLQLRLASDRCAFFSKN